LGYKDEVSDVIQFLCLPQFYAPWCGHCKKLEPIFNHVAQALHDSPVRVGKVDCTRFPTVATEFKVNGYPTIIL
jgi:thioredoxin domain-containing protein 10